MSIFALFRPGGIEAGLTRYRESEGALLLDVRTAEEYAAGHIPGSRNLPLAEIDRAGTLIEDPETPLFLYCYRGTRSLRAAAALKSMGYRQVTSIGGILGYRGELERLSPPR